MLRPHLARPVFLAALLSSGGTFAMDADVVVGPFSAPLSATAAPARVKRPAVPPLTPEQLAEETALAAGAVSEEPPPVHVTLAEVTPRARPVALLGAETAAADATPEVDPATFVPSTVGQAPHTDFAALVSSGDVPEVAVASEGLAMVFEMPVAFDERGDATRRGMAFAQFSAPPANEVASAPATAETVAQALAALENPAPEAEPLANGAPQVLVLAEGEDWRAPGFNVSPRRRPQLPARATAEGGPEVPLVLELRRK